MKPVTDDHPAENGQRVLLDTGNIAKFSKGHIGEVVTRVGDSVRAKVLITDKGLVDAVLGGRNQLSCGYICDLKFEAGEHEGKHFDAVQSNIRYNHVSVVAEGRAGPGVAMRIDSMEGMALETEVVQTDVKEAPQVTRVHLMKPRL